jgi:hypothetical protein
VICWLNANAGAVTALATAALAILTAVYVVLTRQIALASRETVQLAAAAQEAATRQAVRSLGPLISRLSEMVHVLRSPTIQIGPIQRGAFWTEGDMRDLETLARATEHADVEAASRAVKALRFLGQTIEDIKREERGRGWNPNTIRQEEWTANVAAAMEALAKLSESIAGSTR